MKKTRRKRRRSGFGFACAALVLAVACGSLTAAVADRQAPVPTAEADKAEIHADKTAQLSGEASVRLSVPALCQYPELPTGCEATAAAMVLQYYGEAITPSTLAGEWLTCSEQFYWKNGVLYGPDPDKAFAGDPFSQNAYGCFAPVIVRAVNKGSRLCTAQRLKGVTLAQLCSDYIDRGVPLLVWATMDMRPVSQGSRWQLADGRELVWPAGEHCLVLTGYDAERYWFNDPQTGTVVSYEKALCEQRFCALGSQAVLIRRR